RRFLADARRRRCRGCGAIITLTRAVRLGELCIGDGREREPSRENNGKASRCHASPSAWVAVAGNGRTHVDDRAGLSWTQAPSQTGNSRIRWGASICAATKWRRSSRAEAKLPASQISSKRKTRSQPQAAAREKSTMKFKKSRPLGRARKKRPLELRSAAPLPRGPWTAA